MLPWVFRRPWVYSRKKRRRYVAPEAGGGTPTTITLAPLAASATLVAPVVTTGQLVTPDPLAASATVVSPVVTTGQLVSPSPLAGAATLVAPTR